MISKISFVGQLSKTLGYLAFALNNVIRFAGNVTQRVTDHVTNTERYNIDILVEGTTIKTVNNQSSAQLSRLLEVTYINESGKKFIKILIRKTTQDTIKVKK